MPKQTISTLSPVICDSLSLTDKYGQSVENAMDRFSAYPVIVEKIGDRWTVTPISHVHKEKKEKVLEPTTSQPVVIQGPEKKNRRKRSK